MSAQPKPVPMAIVICDQIIEDRLTGKKTLVGLFNSIAARSFPCTHATMSVFVSLTEGRGKYKLAGDWRSVQGNFGGGGGVQNLRGIRTYAKISDLFADKDIDLVDICLPTPLHKQGTLAAFRAGKHVLLEKPIDASLKAAD